MEKSDEMKNKKHKEFNDRITAAMSGGGISKLQQLRQAVRMKR